MFRGRDNFSRRPAGSKDQRAFSVYARGAAGSNRAVKWRRTSSGDDDIVVVRNRTWMLGERRSGVLHGSQRAGYD